MTRPLTVLVLAVLLAGCAAAERTMSPSRLQADLYGGDAEVHRGLRTNLKSSPDSGGGDRGGGSP